MMKSQLWTFLFCFFIFNQSLGMQSQMHDHHSMSHDANGMVMNANYDNFLKPDHHLYFYPYFEKLYHETMTLHDPKLRAVALN